MEKNGKSLFSRHYSFLKPSTHPPHPHPVDTHHPLLVFILCNQNNMIIIIVGIIIIISRSVVSLVRRMTSMTRCYFPLQFPFHPHPPPPPPAPNRFFFLSPPPPPPRFFFFPLSFLSFCLSSSSSTSFKFIIVV